MRQGRFIGNQTPVKEGKGEAVQKKKETRLVTEEEEEKGREEKKRVD